MSTGSILIKPTVSTKTMGERPPIVPPVHTTFDGSSDGDDSLFQRLNDDVRVLVRQADAANGEDLATMMGLLDGRKSMISMEILMALSFEEYPLSPSEDISIDFAPLSTREERMLHTLIDTLDLCRQRCERRLARHRLQMRLLKQLEPSDS